MVTRRALSLRPSLRVAVALALVLAPGGCARHALPPTDPARQPIGVRATELPEGILVEHVHAGSGAAEAGLRAGELIVSVDGIEVRKAPSAAFFALRGPEGSEVDLVARAPLDGEFRELSVRRGPLGLPEALQEPAELEALKEALRRGGARRAGRAAQAARDLGFHGRLASEVLRRELRAALPRRAAAAVAVATVLEDYDPADHALRLLIGEVWYRDRQWLRALDQLQAGEATRPPDVWEPGGAWRGDGGGNAWGRPLLVQVLSELGQDEAARAEAQALLRSRELPGLAARVDLGPGPATEAWRVDLPAIEALELTTLDGQAWRLAEHRGRPVVLAFFATWCAPCRLELTELQALSQELDIEILGLSIDDEAEVPKLPAYARELGLRFPLAHSPQTALDFEVSAVPALRLIGPDGALLYSARGYARETVPRVRALVAEALAAPTSSGSVGRVWSAGEAELVGFLGLTGTQGLVLSDQDLAIGREGGPPVVLAGQGGGADSRVRGPGGGELLAWQEGPVTAAPGERWVRAWSPSARSRWLFTTPDPVRALAGSGELLWVATDGALLALDALGRLQHQLPGGASDLAPHPEGGVWAVDGTDRRWIDPSGQERSRVPALGARRVDGLGRVASAEFDQVVSGRLGPAGALRTVLARHDGMVVGLDGQGQPALTWQLDQAPRLALADLDGDGLDELLVAIRHQGLATVRLVLP